MDEKQENTEIKKEEKKLRLEGNQAILDPYIFVKNVDIIYMTHPNLKFVVLYDTTFYN